MINKFVLKEGQKSVIILGVATIISALFICSFLTTLLAIVTIVVLFIYRVPAHKSIQISGIVSPCDGEITAIDKVNGKEVIYVKLSLLDTHVLRAPISSAFEITQVRHGVNLSGDSFKAKNLNEQIVVKFEKIKIALLAHKFNFITHIESPKALTQNEPFGVMIHGEVKITLPKKIHSKIAIGQKVYAGSTPLA